MKVMFLIPALEVGGAEQQLVELVKHLDKTLFAVTLVTLAEGGALRPEVERLAGVNIFSLQKKRRWDLLRALLRLVRLARETHPHVMHGYMNYASELCLFAGRLVSTKVVWSLRATNMDYARYGWGLRWTFQMGAWLSRFPDLIIVNSYAGKEYHTAHGYDSARMIVIPNGIDTERFCPNPQAGQHIRVEWGIAKHEIVFGLVGRLDVMKDHPSFLRAAAELARERSDVRFVCVGTGPESYAAELRRMGEMLGLGNRLIWTGAQYDMPAVYNALNVLTSSSYGEGFPNVIGEAMACGVPCVVTDVGDSARIVGETGIVVPPRDVDALTQAWRRWLTFTDTERLARGVQARARIVREFGLPIMVTKTEAALQGLLKPQSQS